MAAPASSPAKAQDLSAFRALGFLAAEPERLFKGSPQQGFGSGEGKPARTPLKVPGKRFPYTASLKHVTKTKQKTQRTKTAEGLAGQRVARRLDGALESSLLPEARRQGDIYSFEAAGIGFRVLGFRV